MKTWNKVKEIFSKALELDKSERVSFIKNACRGDPKLRDEVLSLIDAHEMPGMLDRPIDDIRLSAISLAKEDRMKGKIIGNYRIIDELGHGGMGSVYLVIRADGEFDQRAALKLMHNPFATDRQIKRFKSERQILASLEHDNIARLLDGGVTDSGQPYYVMELVDGLPIDQYCEENTLTVNERLELFMDVCKAVQYAHRKLIVHRDLKPSNILVTNDGRIKLLDFGIAKVLGDEGPSAPNAPLTRPGLLPLTPSYSSPEQILGREVNISSDIYQLGVVLYELLSCCKPYDIYRKTPAEIEHTICEEIPEPPSTAVGNIRQEAGDAPRVIHSVPARPQQLKKKLMGDLDTIILHAMQKEPERRYESAEQLGTDIRLYLSNRPVTAHPDSRIYRIGKYVNRHRWGLSATMAIFLSLIIGIGVAVWQAREAREALVKTEEALSRAESLHGFLTDLFLPGALNRPSGEMPGTEELLEKGAQQALDGDISEPAERLGMLVTLADIYIRRGWPDQARPLLDAAVTLGERYSDEWPQDLARALYLQARIASWDGERDKSEKLYLEAENILNESGQFWELYARVKSGRGYLEYYRGNYTRVLDIAEPLFEELEGRNHPDLHLRNRILNLLANTYSYLGDLKKADEFQTEVIDNYRELDGEDSRTYAISLTNSVKIKYNSGQFEKAEENALEAISIYDKLYEKPTSVMSVTYGALAVSRLLEGRFEEALSTLETAGIYFARVRDKDFGKWEVPKIYKGMMLANMQRWREAEPYLLDFRERFDEVHHSMLFTSLDGLLAETLCSTGKVEQGKAVLAEWNKRNEPAKSPVYRAKIYDAKAKCLKKEGDTGKAMEEIAKAIEVMKYPGRAMERANRKLFYARLLAEEGHAGEASRQVASAKQLFLDTGLSSHPMLEQVRTVDSNLALNREE